MYETSHRLRKYQCFFSSGSLHYCNGPYFLEMAHNFGNPGAIGPYACFAFPISVGPVAFADSKKEVSSFLMALLWSSRRGGAPELATSGQNGEVTSDTISKSRLQEGRTSELYPLTESYWSGIVNSPEKPQ